MLALATPVLEKLTTETGESGHFAIRSGSEIVVVARTAGIGMLQLADRTGATRPVHATALGKVADRSAAAAQLKQLLVRVAAPLHPEDDRRARRARARDSMK